MGHKKKVITILVILFTLIIIGAVALILILQKPSDNSDAKDKSQKIVKLTACIDDTDLNNDIDDSNLKKNLLVRSSECPQPSVSSSVYLNYSFIGYTDSKGDIDLRLKIDSNYLIHIVDREYEYGFTQSIVSNEMVDTKVYLQSDYLEPLITNVNGLDEDMLFVNNNYNWSTFDVFFHYKNSSQREHIYQIRGIQVFSSLVPEKIFDLTLDTFVLNEENNLISVKNSYNIQNAISNLQKHGAIRFNFLVDLELDKGSIYYQAHFINVYLTQFTISGQILKESMTQMDLTQVKVTFLSITNNLLFQVKPDSDGRFKSTELPIGTYYFEASYMTSKNEKFMSKGNVLLSANTNMNVYLLSLSDLALGLDCFNYTQGYLSSNRRIIAKDMTNNNQKDIPLKKKQDSSTYISVITTGAVKDQIVSTVKELVLNSKSEIVRLTYVVQSEEYPYYVMEQSIFNDLWSLSVYLDTGDIIYSIDKDVNSMLFSEPLWLSTGFTEIITVDLDVSKFVKENKVKSIFLKATSVNIGDSILDTTVISSLEIQSTDLIIKSIDFNGFVECVSSNRPKPCYKVKDILSIPPFNENNVYHKYLLVKYETDDLKMTLNNIETYIVPEGLKEILILSSKVNGDTIKQIDKSTLQIRVTFTKPNLIQFNEFDKFNFKVILYYVNSQENVNIKTADKLSSKMTALWKAPYYNDPSKRYSFRDLGDDSWANVEMSKWIKNNVGTGLWSRYNDISGEHSLNLGHSSHQIGNHIDIFHYYTLDSTSGGNNYNAFYAAVKAKDTSKVKAWVLEHRKKFDQLNSDPSVVQVLTHKGNHIKYRSNENLTNNWLRFLMEKGKIEKFLSLELNSWTSPTKVKWVSDHKDHIHIQIRY